MSVTSTIVAIDAASALITVGINALLAAQKYQTLIANARNEGREVSDEELAALASESEDLTKEVLGLLNEDQS